MVLARGLSWAGLSGLDSAGSGSNGGSNISAPPFSFCRDVRSGGICDWGLMGIFDGDFVGEAERGAELNFSAVCCLLIRRGIRGGSSSSRLAAAMRDLRSDSELRRFFLTDLVSNVSTSGSPMVSSR